MKTVHNNITPLKINDYIPKNINGLSPVCFIYRLHKNMNDIPDKPINNLHEYCL